MSQIKCVVCGNDFEAKRKDAKTCSDKCRQSIKRNVTDNTVTDKVVTDKPLVKDSWLCKEKGCNLKTPVGHNGMCIYHWRKSLNMPTISKEDYEELNLAQKEI